MPELLAETADFLARLVVLLPQNPFNVVSRQSQARQLAVKKKIGPRDQPAGSCLRVAFDTIKDEIYLTLPGLCCTNEPEVAFPFPFNGFIPRVEFGAFHGP